MKTNTSILTRLRKSYTFKVLCAFTSVNFLFQVVNPTVSLALTGGPSQPEVNSFEPVNTTQMVDLFSGDFNYNIPLLTVPGPNGGYPINLAYHAGIGMEQQASWVGLGWNINPGAIVRNMRGLPDDFNGDKIEKEINLKPNVTVGLGVSRSILTNREILGADLSLNKSTQLYFNNYKGVGLRHNLALSATGFEGFSSWDENGLGFRAALDFDSQGGVGFSPSLSFTKQGQEVYHNFSLGANFHSTQGLQGLKLNYDIPAKTIDKTIQVHSSRGVYETTKKTGQALNAPGIGTGISYSTANPVPNVSFPMSGLNFQAGINLYRTEAGPSTIGTPWERVFNGKGEVSINRIKEDDQDFILEGYGYQYAENRGNKSDAIMDFNRSRVVNLNRRIPFLPTASTTYDVFAIQGQGIGGMFRPFRSDIGVLYDNVQFNTTTGGAVVPEVVSVEQVATDGTMIKVGGDFSYTVGETRSGGWTGNASNLTGTGENDIDFIKSSPFDPLYEPSYFKVTGEQTGSPLDELDHLAGVGPVRFDLQMKLQGDRLEPIVFNQLSDDNEDSQITKLKRETRQKRVQSVQKRTIAQVTNDAEFSKKRPLLFGGTNEAPFPHFDYGQSGSTLIYPADLPDQIGQMEVVNPDGNRYIYGLPAYNKTQEDVVFALDSETPYVNPPRVSYDPVLASVENRAGADHYYNSTTIPDYAHSFLLTQVVSTDYVDVTGDGPSDDDLGYFAKFNYTKLHDNYKWRTPYSGANYTQGFASYTEDDKGTFTYGEKEIFLLNSIETKTHLAVFILQDREDAIGAMGRDVPTAQSTFPPQFPANGQRLKCLKEIRLYSKNDVNTINAATGMPDAEPIKTVHFEYNYELCPGIENNTGRAITKDGALITGPDAATDDNNINKLKGKLTLKKVFFTYLSNSKGALSPYKFEYSNPINPNQPDPLRFLQNPTYNLLQVDRWGKFRSDNIVNMGDRYLNIENPYVFQDEDYDMNGSVSPLDERRRNYEASAWSMRRIQLPSGGIINIQYEADDYSHVQDKQATQMLEFVGTSTLTGTEPETLTNGGNLVTKLNKNHRRIWFKLEKSVDASADALEVARSYFEEDGTPMQNLYFKTYQRLKRPPGEPIARGYVDGYAKIIPSSYGLSSDRTLAYCDVESMSYGIGNNKQVHPFRLAGWQHIRYSRPDLFDRPNTGDTDIPDNIANLIIETLTTFGQVPELITGFYNAANFKGFSRFVELETKPSYVRVLSPDKIKYGGDCRVSRLTLNDQWIRGGQTNTNTIETEGHEYGQTYSYRNLDGTSSGVATYEPIIGGEENPLRQPIWYNGNESRISFRTEDAFIETPLAEPYYPGASVGYGRVVVSSIQDQAIDPATNATETLTNFAATGVTQHEFFTCKDFPLIENFTDIKNKHDIRSIPIPFVGSRSVNMNGYSQGFSVELNDMHGKPKSVATFQHNADFKEEPTTQVQYKYSIDSQNPNRINNLVTTLTRDGEFSSTYLGRTFEFFVDMQEDNSFSITDGTQVNLEADTDVGAVIGSVFRTFELNESMQRTVATNKIIYKTGILEETTQYADGASITTKNLMYDAETGTPLLTVVQNEYDNPIYTYNYASHWVYSGMEPAYRNVGANLIINLEAGATYKIRSSAAGAVFSTPSNFLEPGDELVDGNGERFYVESVDDATSSFELLDKNNQPAAVKADGMVRIDRSGKRNQQSFPNGTLVSLSNPLVGSDVPLFTAFNEAMLVNPSAFIVNQPGTFTVIDCDGSSRTGRLFRQGANLSTIAFTLSPLDATNALCESAITFDRNLPQVLTSGSLTLEDDDVTVSAIFNGETYTGTLNTASNCITRCTRPRGILHAEAVEFNEDQWGDQYNYFDVGNRTTDLNGLTLSEIQANNNGNKWRYGMRGIWRTDRTHLFQVEREDFAGVNDDFETEINKDGTYENFVSFNWNDPTANVSDVNQDEVNSGWIWSERITQYNTYGFAIESENAINVHSAEMYGYDASVVTAAAANSEYMEMGFDGFARLSG